MIGLSFLQIWCKSHPNYENYSQGYSIAPPLKNSQKIG